jgi:hypothetical protein
MCCSIFQKVAQKVSKAKKARISTTKLNLKARKIYTKPLLKPKNTHNKPCFETAYLGVKVINLFQQKVAQNIAISLGYFIFSKNHEPPKVAQLVEKLPKLVTLVIVQNKPNLLLEIILYNACTLQLFTISLIN